MDPSSERALALSIRPVVVAKEGAAAAPGDLVDAVRVFVVRPPSEILAEELVSRSPGQESVSVELRVTLREWVETLQVGVELLAGELILFSGSQTVEVRVGSSGNRVVDIPVEYVGPRPSVLPQSLDITTTIGADPPDQSLTVSNNGVGVLNWTAVSEASWITVSPVSGTLDSSQSEEVTVKVTALELPLGDQTTTVLFQDANLGLADTVTVRLQVVRQPEIGVSPEGLVFWAQEGSDPEAKSFVLTNEGGGTLTWSVASQAGWILLSPASGALEGGQSATVTVDVDAAGLSPGSYQTSITVEAPQASNSPWSIPVSLVAATRPRIGLNPQALSFSSLRGSDPPAQTLVLTNEGGSTLDWQASDDAPWLEVNPASGAVDPGQSLAVSVNVATSGLGSGDYTGTVTISDPEASNSPQTLSVLLTVKPDPEIGLSRRSLSYTTRIGLSPPGREEVITNTGGGTLSWSASSDKDWLSVSPQDGELAEDEFQDLNLRFDTQDLGEGTYNATVTVADPAASNSPETISVKLEILAEPMALISLDRGSIAFTAQKGTDPARQTFRIRNLGWTPLDWTASDDATWLSLSRTSGTLDTDAAASVPVNVASAGLEPGTYQATITVADPEAENSPQRVVVVLIVHPGPAIGVDPGDLSFVAPTGADPSPQILTLSNTGTGVLSWSARGIYDCPPSGCPFNLQVTPASGTVVQGETASLSVQVNSSQADPGVYAGTAWVEITDPLASNSPVTVPVALTVADPVPPAIFDISYSLKELNSANCSFMNPVGSLFEVRFRFHDDNGDVRQESARLTIQYQYEGAASDEFSQPPQGGLTVTGNGFDGEVISEQCHRFGSFSNWVKLTHTLADAREKGSNSLVVTIPKPPGANTPVQGGSRSGGSGGGTER